MKKKQVLIKIINNKQNKLQESKQIESRMTITFVEIAKNNHIQEVSGSHASLSKNPIYQVITLQRNNELKDGRLVFKDGLLEKLKEKEENNYSKGNFTLYYCPIERQFYINGAHLIRLNNPDFKSNSSSHMGCFIFTPLFFAPEKHLDTGSINIVSYNNLIHEFNFIYPEHKVKAMIPDDNFRKNGKFSLTQLD